MQVTLNDKTFTFPSSLAEFTLGQRIDFQIDHGNELDEMFKSIVSIEDNEEKTIELNGFYIEMAYRHFSFFSGIDLELLKASEHGDLIIRIFDDCSHILFQDESKVTLEDEFVWKGEFWTLGSYKTLQDSKRTFDELTDSKQSVKDCLALGKGRWEAALKIAAVFLRREGEAYDESFLYEDSERLKLMRDLPMNIVMPVCFFLIAFLNFCWNTSLSSSQLKELLAGLRPNTSIYGDGQISSKLLRRLRFLMSQTVARTA